ncbi:hypothetical protein G6F56_006181 [Rhizopus delemar]|nr:hypothetical protein G6F56_006181 [Rhizopus delemar]
MLIVKYAQQIANYEVVKINTAYLNGVSLQFGKKAAYVLESYFEQGQQNSSLEDSSEIGTIQKFFDCYSADYKFGKNSIYYDCMANPVEHLRAYYYLANHCESKYNKPFNCFPLRRTFVPCYMTIDTYILNTQILGNSVISHLEKDVIWGSVLNMQSKGMRPQGESQQLMFRGTVYTDGVGISILKQNHDSKKKCNGGKQKKVDMDDDVPYVHTLSKKQLLADTGKCILVDPGRRDMLYCMHESSAIQKKSLYRYTSNQRNVETKTRKFRKLRDKSKPAAVTAAEVSLGRFCSSTVVLQKFIDYLHQSAEVAEVLDDYYANEDLSKEERPDGVLPFRKMKLSRQVLG